MKRLVFVNLLLGIPGIIYYWMMALMVLRTPLTSWGQMAKDWYEANSLLPMQSVLGPPLAICTMIWVLSNFNVISHRTDPGEHGTLRSNAVSWSLAVAASLIPAAIVLLIATFF